MYSRSCLWCEKVFRSDNEKQRFCSKDCYNNHKKEETRKKREKKCIFCNKIFESQYPKAVFCSIQCSANDKKQKRGKKEKICQICKKEFIPCHSNSKFCSQICSGKSHDKKRLIKCLNCGKEKLILNYLKQKFCSIECGGIYRKIHKTSKPANKIETKCVCCGKKFLTWPYRKKTIKFCSVECHDNYRRVKITCPTCKKQFISPKWEKRKYCSEQCSSLGVDKRKSNFSVDVKRFLDKNFSKHKIVSETLFKDKNKKTFSDFFFIDFGLVIECDGTYWHCDKFVYDSNYYNSRVKKYAHEIWKEDTEKDLFIASFGCIVIRLREYEWSKNTDMFFKTLEENLNEIFKSEIGYVNKI